MSIIIDWTIRVRHESHRPILPEEISKIEYAISDRLGFYDNALETQDFYENIYVNSFSSESHFAQGDMRIAMLEISELFPEFVFQVEAVRENHEGDQTNYYRGDLELCPGSIVYEPHYSIRF